MDEPKRPKPTKGQTKQAQRARQEPSSAEEIVWKLLRNRRQGFKFKREAPFGPYRLDFYCAEARLALEMDGEQHDPDRDAVRDSYLANYGIFVFRVPNVQFFGIDREASYKDPIEAMLKVCEQRAGRSRY